MIRTTWPRVPLRFWPVLSLDGPFDSALDTGQLLEAVPDAKEEELVACQRKKDSEAGATGFDTVSSAQSASVSRVDGCGDDFCKRCCSSRMRRREVCTWRKGFMTKRDRRAGKFFTAILTFGQHSTERRSGWRSGTFVVSFTARQAAKLACKADAFARAQAQKGPTFCSCNRSSDSAVSMGGPKDLLARHGSDGDNTMPAVSKRGRGGESGG